MNPDKPVNCGKRGDDRFGRLLVAHRGAQAEAPENTYAAFEKAIQRGADGIELDIQLTADGVPIVFHDNTLSRIFGIDRPVTSFTIDEISGFDAGKWFSPAFVGEPIPTLEGVFQRYAGKTALLIEIKSLPFWGERLEHRKDAALAVTNMIRRMAPGEKADRIFVLSFDQSILDIVRLEAPGIKRIRNLDVLDGMHPYLPGRNRDLFAYGLDKAGLSTDIVKAAHEQGCRVMAYSFNTCREIHSALNSGVDIVLTDDPSATVGYFRAGQGS